MELHRNRWRLWALPTALTAAAALTSGCSGGTPQPSPSRSTSARATAPGSTRGPQQPPAATSGPGTPGNPAHTAGTATSSGVAWCTTTDLTAAVHALQPAAGNRHAALRLTNTSTHPCRTEGYPGLQLADSAGHPLPTTVVRDRSGTPQPLTLVPGGSAWARLRWGAVAGAGEPATGDCQPPAAVAEVTAPDQTSRLTVAWRLGPVCEHGRIDELPLTAGNAPAY